MLLKMALRFGVKFSVAMETGFIANLCSNWSVSLGNCNYCQLYCQYADIVYFLKK